MCTVFLVNYVLRITAQSKYSNKQNYQLNTMEAYQHCRGVKVNTADVCLHLAGETADEDPQFLYYVLQ